MSSRVALSAVLFAIPLTLGAVPCARAGAWSLAPGEYYTGFLGSWSSSDHYYDQDGKKTPIAGGGLIEERSLTSRTELGFNAPRWVRFVVFGIPGLFGASKYPMNFVLELPARSVTREFAPAAPGSALSGATGLGDVLVGFRLPIARGRGRVAAALEADWSLPLGYERNQFLTHADSVAASDPGANSLDQNQARQLGSPVLGDGMIGATLMLRLGTALTSHGFLQASGGFRSRFVNPADAQSQIVAGADLGVWLSGSLLLAGRYQGEIATSNGNPPTRESTRHRLGPMLVYRVDDHLDLILSSMHTAAATNALHTDEVFVGVAFRQSKLNRLQGFLGGSARP